MVEDESGVSRFSALQAGLKAGRRDHFVYYAFDLLHLDGADLMPLPLVERKAALARLLARAAQAGPIRLSAHFEGEGALVLQRSLQAQLEGIVSKRAQSPYVSGRSSWIRTRAPTGRSSWSSATRPRPFRAMPSGP